MNPDPADYPNIDFLSAALRSWLVNHLISEPDLQELTYLLLELGYADPPTEPRDFLKREMSRLAVGGAEARLRLIRLCEGLVQFYLLRHPRETAELDQFNRFLPPGLLFSTVTGRLLFEPKHYYQTHNLHVQEQNSWYIGKVNGSPEHRSEAFPRLPGIDPSKSEPVQGGESNDFHHVDTVDVETSAALTPMPEAEGIAIRNNHFRDIRKRRLQLLKEWETHHEQA